MVGLANGVNKINGIATNGRSNSRDSGVKESLVGDAELLARIEAYAEQNPEFAENINALRSNQIKITLSHEPPGFFEKHVSELLAENPTTLKCVLSDKLDISKPSLYIKDGGHGAAPQIAFASRQVDSNPFEDLNFAIKYINQWHETGRKWPAVYAYYQPPEAIPEEWLSGVHNMPVSELKERPEVCDLSGAGLKPYHGEKAPARVTARVITIKVAQGDNKPVANAIETQTQPGDVIFVDGGGHAASVTLGGITASLGEKVRGLKGIIIYGEVRDQVELKSLSIPVFGLGCSSNGPTKVGPGSVHCSVNIGRAKFKSGDIIKIDKDQIFVIPVDKAPGILGLGQSTREIQSIESGNPSRFESPPETIRKTFAPLEKPAPKNRSRPPTPDFIPQLFKDYSPAQICDTASFINSGRLWGAGIDMILPAGSIPDGQTLVGTAVISDGVSQNLIQVINDAKKGDFLVVSGNEDVSLDAEILERVHASGIIGIVINGKANLDEGVCKKYGIPIFLNPPVSSPRGSRSKTSQPAPDRPLDRVELKDGFLIKKGYVVMADIDGIAAFSPTKFAMFFRAGYKKNMQEKTAEERNKSGHPHPLPDGSIITDRYYEPFVHAHIDQFPFLRAPRGWAKMQLPTDPEAIFVGNGGQRVRLESGNTIKGVPINLIPRGEEPIAFTLEDENGVLSEVEGVSGRELFEVAVAIDRGETIEVQADGSVAKPAKPEPFPR